jgi:hypothetical protein
LSPAATVGLAPLKNFSDLQELTLNDTEVSDVRLAHLLHGRSAGVPVMPVVPVKPAMPVRVVIPVTPVVREPSLVQAVGAKPIADFRSRGHGRPKSGARSAGARPGGLNFQAAQRPAQDAKRQAKE